MKLLPDRVVLVSGGTQGLGAATARAAAREGAAVMVSGRRPEPGEKLAAELRGEGADAGFVQADVADVASAQASVAATVERFGRIDSLVSAARNAAHTHRFDRIRINGIDIGWTDTEGEDDIQRRSHGATDGWRERAARELPMGKLGQPGEIADFVVFLLSGRSGVVTGSVIDWDQNVPGAHD
jgi:NAD(P)-dependent dehydrogenase (short-subunit alcohol dehydrogenase family)